MCGTLKTGRNPRHSVASRVGEEPGFSPKITQLVKARGDRLPFANPPGKGWGWA